MSKQVASYYSVIDLLLAAAVTPLHPGAGRSPGVVDLPVQRDPYGYPIVPATGFKGALKTFLAVSKGCVITSEKDPNRGKVDCGKCPEICCLLGPEVGEGDAGASSVAFTDLMPLAVPVPSLEHGIVYVTSPLLAARARDVVETAGGPPDLATALDEIIQASSGLQGAVVATSWAGSGTVTIGLDRIPIARQLDQDKLKALNELAGGLSSIHRSRPVSRALVVAPDTLAPSLIEKGLYRVTRVRLDRSRKTVARGALWTEEYLPPGTLLIGAVAYTKPRNAYCSKARLGNADAARAREELHRLLGGESFAIVIGGKESTGHGILKARLVG